MARHWWDGLKESEKRLWTAVALVLGLVEKDGAPGQRQNLDDDETLALYVKDCREAGLTHEMVWSARDDVRHGSQFFPRPGEFVKAVSAHVRDRWPVISAVVGEHDGVPIVSNRPVSPLSQEWAEHTDRLRASQESGTVPALPADPEREAARERLEKALARLPERRVRPARERSEFFEGEDPEAAERLRRMVDGLGGAE